MFYELVGGKLLGINECVNRTVLDNSNLFITHISNGDIVIINTFNNRCFVVTKESFSLEGVGNESDYFNTKLPEEYEPIINESVKVITFILAITYSCNYQCTYCYQQHDKKLNKKLISEDDLSYIFEVIKNYKENHPEYVVQLGLFGGEPLLPTNEIIIDKVFDFCKRNFVPVNIVTNGSYLEYYMKKIVINRAIIGTICPTIDSTTLNHVTRRSISGENNYSNTEKLIKCIRTLLYYGIKVNVATNIDGHNVDQLEIIKNDFEQLGLLQNKECFEWSIGRVDDRLCETGYKDIITEGEIIEKMLEIKRPANMHAAFIKTAYNLLDKIGVDIKQSERRGVHNYCWNSSPQDMVFYIDAQLKTYRCTYTVGRPNYSIMDFSLENIENYNPVNRTALYYDRCKKCNIGGYCGGGCQLTYQINPDSVCKTEKESFEYFVEHVLIKFIEKLRCTDEANLEVGSSRTA